MVEQKQLLLFTECIKSRRKLNFVGAKSYVTYDLAMHQAWGRFFCFLIYVIEIVMMYSEGFF
jgi:hypothetical protein